jgi:hypothetical protein
MRLAWPSKHTGPHGNIESAARRGRAFLLRVRFSA